MPWSYLLLLFFLQGIDKCKKGTNRFYTTPVQRMWNLGGHFLKCFSEQRKGLHIFLHGAWALARLIFSNPSTKSDAQWAVLSSATPCPSLHALEKGAGLSLARSGSSSPAQTQSPNPPAMLQPTSDSRSVMQLSLSHTYPHKSCCSNFAGKVQSTTKFYFITVRIKLTHPWWQCKPC